MKELEKKEAEGEENGGAMFIAVNQKEGEKGKKSSRSKSKNRAKKAFGGNNQFDCVIKMKDEEGKI